MPFQFLLIQCPQMWLISVYWNPNFILPPHHIQQHPFSNLFSNQMCEKNSALTGRFNDTVNFKNEALTCQCAGVSKGSDLRVWKSSEQRNDRVHHVFVIDYAVLTLTDQNHYELAKVIAKFLPLRSCHRERVITAVLDLTITNNK